MTKMSMFHSPSLRIHLGNWGMLGSGVARGGGGGGGKRGNCPPFFQGERVGGRAICHVVTLGDEQTRRGTGYSD